ncbi:MAG: hypothetical protein ACFFEF_17010 [Candidatus Thorarchaeota archaeon]
MRRAGACILFVLLLVIAMVIGALYLFYSQPELVDYDSTVVLYEEDYPTTENISIYYDVCFHNVTFNVVDDPGFIIKINWKLTVLVEGAVGLNTNLQVTTSSNDEYMTIQILKENPSAICGLRAGDAEATVNVTINSAYTIDLEASAGDGNINLVASNASFDTIYFHHGINCIGNNTIDIANSIVYEDVISEVSTGRYWVRLDTVIVRGSVSCTPEGSGTLIII